MTDKILYWTTVVFASLALLLFIANVTLIKGNQGIQDDINQRQGVINMAANVAPLNQQLSQALYDAYSKTKDEAIRTLLTEQGFTLNDKAPPKIVAPAKAKKAAPKKAKKEEE